MSENIEKRYRRAAQIINSAGGTPLPINEDLISILNHLIKDEQLDFIYAFKRKKSQTMEQLKESTNLAEAEIIEKAKKLAKIGLIFDQPNRHGVIVYKLMPFINVGVFEYTYMGKVEDTEENRELAILFKNIVQKLKGKLSEDYDLALNFINNIPPIDRTIPFEKNLATGKDIEIIIDKELEVPSEKIIPVQKIEEIIEKFSDIAVGGCFCRNHQDLLDNPCKQTDIRENCFTFGKSARFTSDQGFSRLISKGEALEILRKSEEDGLVHKAYHPNFDVLRDETSICNCCTCCCGQANGLTVNSTNYIAQVNQDICTGCGTCVENCHTQAMELNSEGKAERLGDYCIGCGVCAYYCPENAISLLEKERIVRIPPFRSS